MAYINETQCLKSILREVKSSPKGKGFILCCDDFDAFLWNSSKQLKHLIAALSSWTDSQEGFQLEVVRQSTETIEFEVVLSKQEGKKIPMSWYLSVTGYSTSPKESELETNPFLE